ncbi:MAG: hypothetical protein A2Z04_00750 [Chloroflexi bacterium RBG_16_57_9]|nr:MAG: hypothetical protein A2Z04_00750 [Chloroflexi bacterium RBG_16_57_9]
MIPVILTFQFYPIYHDFAIMHSGEVSHLCTKTRRAVVEPTLRVAGVDAKTGREGYLELKARQLE